MVSNFLPSLLRRHIHDWKYTPFGGGMGDRMHFRRCKTDGCDGLEFWTRVSDGDFTHDDWVPIDPENDPCGVVHYWLGKDKCIKQTHLITNHG